MDNLTNVLLFLVILILVYFIFNSAVTQITPPNVVYVLPNSAVEKEEPNQVEPPKSEGGQVVLTGGQYLPTRYVRRPHWGQGYGWGSGRYGWGRGRGWGLGRWWPYYGNDSQYNTCRDYAEKACALSSDPQYCIPYAFRACGGDY